MGFRGASSEQHSGEITLAALYEEIRADQAQVMKRAEIEVTAAVKMWMLNVVTGLEREEPVLVILSGFI